MLTSYHDVERAENVATVTKEQLIDMLRSRFHGVVLHAANVERGEILTSSRGDGTMQRIHEANGHGKLGHEESTIEVYQLPFGTGRGRRCGNCGERIGRSGKSGLCRPCVIRARALRKKQRGG